MRIAYITDQLLPRTATDTGQMVSMASALGAAGADVTLVRPGRWFRREPGLDEIAAYYRVPPTFSIDVVRSVYPNIRGVEKLAQGLVGPLRRAAKEADVLYTRTLPILTGALLTTDRPVVYETYRPWPLQKPASTPFFRWIGRHPNFLGAVLHSALATDSYARAGVPPERLLTAHNGYDPRLLDPVLTREEARRRCGLPLEGPVVTYAGRVSMKKGLGLVLDLAEALPTTRFVLVGSEGEGPVEQRARRLSNVTVVPWQPFDRTVPYLYAADVLLIPPTRGPLEAVGNTVLPIKTFLYMAAERAIFAPDTPDLRELLVDGHNAVLVRPDDPEEARRRLSALLADTDLRTRLAAQARTDGAMLTWDRRAQRVLGFIEERLEARGHAG